jgi:hypothetical protein
MKRKIAVYTAALLFFAQNFAFAQNSIGITGKITDASGKGLDGATVFLRRGSDSTLVKTAVADAAGVFSFEQLKGGSYKLVINMMGYQSYKSDVFELQQQKTFPVIVLEVAGKTLNTVTISGQRPFVERKIDRTIVNPESMLTAAGGTAIDVLEKAPGVIVDQNGAVTLNGKAVTIFIDDKPAYLSGADLESYLRSISSANIDQVELMSNPPAKYDAAGSGGVINIKTKKNNVRGFNGNLNSNFIHGKYFRSNNSLNFNYRKNRINVFGNFNYNYNNSFNDLEISRHFSNATGALTSNFIQNSDIRNSGSGTLAKVGVDYYSSEKNTFGLILTGLSNPYHKRTLVNSTFSNAANQLDSTIVANNQQYADFKNGRINFNFRHQHKNGRELSADADYLTYQTGNEQSFNNNSYFSSGTIKGSELLTGDLPASINIFTVKTDYDHPLKNGFKLATGLKSSFIHTDNIANYFYTKAGLTTPDYGKTNHFLYKENINAVYLNANKEGKHFSIQAGLRLEHTITNGHQLGNIQKADSTFKTSYTSLFPTIYLQYKLDTAAVHQFVLDYGRRVNRPNYQDLNPFLAPLDRFTYYTGNPFLRASFTDNIELSHTYKNRFTTTIGYSRTHDDVNETIEIVNGIYYSRPGNIGEYTNLSLSFDANFDLSKKVSYRFYGTVVDVHAVSDFYTGLLDTRGTFYFFNSAFTFKFGKDWTAQIDGNYRSEITSAQFLLGKRGAINTAISKKLSPSSTIKLVANDLFYTQKNTGVINNLSQTTADWRNLSDTRNVVLSFSYRFGKAISGQRQHNANGAQDEQGRVKN